MEDVVAEVQRSVSLNFTDSIGSSETARQLQFQNLAAKIKGQNLFVTTTQNAQLSGAAVENGTLKGQGLAFEIMDILAKKYEFTYNIVLPKESSLEKEGNGVFTLLDKGEANITAAFLPVMPLFSTFIDYSKALDEGEWVVLMKRPQESATGSGLWAPFTFQVWILVLLSLLIVGPVIYGLIVLEARLRKDDHCPIFPLPSCVWFVYGALLKQGSTLSPVTDSSRILFATWWIFITILTAFYTANLTAFLTLSKFTLPVNKVEDIGTKKWPWITPKGGAIEEALKQSDDYKKQFSGSVGTYTIANGSRILYESVNDQNMLYIGEKPIVEYLMFDDYMYNSENAVTEEERCTFVITKWTVLTTNRAFAFQRNFEFADLFNDVIQHLVESGIIKYKLRDKLPNTEICPRDLGGKERQLYNSDLFMTYVIVGAGFIVSAAIFICELVLNHYKGREMQLKTPKMHGLFAEDNHNFLHRRKNGEFKFATFTDNNNVKGKLWHEMDGTPAPPPYHALFQPPFAGSPNGVKKRINGRDYWMVKSIYGETKLIPVRSPSAMLFQNDRR